MTEVMNSLEPGTEDFSGVEQEQIRPQYPSRYPKLSKRLPSIVVEPMDGAEVESGELRWPPDEPSSPDGQTERPSADEQTERQSADEQTERQSADEQTERQSADEQTADEDQSNVDADQEASGAEIQDSN